MKLSHGAQRGCEFESGHPRHLSLMLYKLALSEPGCISGKFVGNLSYRLGKVCPLSALQLTTMITAGRVGGRSSRQDSAYYGWFALSLLEHPRKRLSNPQRCPNGQFLNAAEVLRSLARVTLPFCVCRQIENGFRNNDL
jgi:hypothetical protein